MYTETLEFFMENNVRLNSKQMSKLKMICEGFGTENNQKIARDIISKLDPNDPDQNKDKIELNKELSDLRDKISEVEEEDSRSSEYHSDVSEVQNMSKSLAQYASEIEKKYNIQSIKI